MEPTKTTSTKTTHGAAARIIAGLALALAACGEPDAPSENAAGTDPLTLAQLADAVDARWTMVEELRVGPGDGPQQFGGLKGLVALEDGGFAVLDSQSQEIRVFDAGGAHVATHGRRGEGPGEMEFPNGLMSRDGLLWAPDPANVRMSLFDPVDGFLEVRPYATNLTEWVWGGAVGTEGRVFARGLSQDRASVLVVYDSAMIPMDTLPLEDPDSESEDAFCWSPSEGTTNCWAVPFYAQRVTLLDPEGYVWERESGFVDYRIRKWMPGGDTVLVVTGDRQPSPVPTAARDSAIADFEERLAGTADFDRSRVPQSKAVVQDLFLSAEGNLWVKLSMPHEQAAFDVWTPDGAHLGAAVTDIPVHLTNVAPVVRGDQVWFVARDELDLEYVVRARLAPVEAGGA